MIYLFLFALVLLVIYVYAKSYQYEQYWKKNGIKMYTKHKIFGPFWEFLTGDRTMFLVLSDIYKENPDEQAVAFGPFFQPSLFVIDPKIAQSVLQTEFHTFNHRGIEPFEGDVLSDMVLFQNGNKWKLVRQHLTPIFTSAKLKNMYYIMDKSAKDFIKLLHESPEKWHANTYGTLSQFCAAAIGATVFGITSKSIFDNPFHEVALKVVAPNFKTDLKFSLANISMSLSKFMKLKLFTEYEHFFVSTLRQIMEQRKGDNSKRHDFVELCLSLQQNEVLKDRETNFEVKPTTELLAAQAFFFFVAGVEPSASAAFATLVELGRNPEHLKKVQNAIDEAFEKHNGELSYDIVNGVEELDRAMNEAMRMYPPIAFLTRKCLKDTVLPDGNIEIKKGTKIFISIFDYQHDPKYYPDPEVFNPDRFDPNLSFNKDLYTPFGKGGRLCIGNRYAQIQVKTGLLYLLRHFDVVTHVGKGGIKYVKRQVQLQLKNVDVEFVPRNIKGV